MCYFAVRNKKELVDIIIPFFDTYLLNVQKHQDFLPFKSAVSILHTNKGKGFNNLMHKQRQYLDYCISKMNKNRYKNS